METLTDLVPAGVPAEKLNGYEESLNMNPYHLAGHFYFDGCLLRIYIYVYIYNYIYIRSLL